MNITVTPHNRFVDWNPKTLVKIVSENNIFRLEACTLTSVGSNLHVVWTWVGF